MNLNISSERYTGIDLLRFICAFFVIYIHTAQNDAKLLLPLTRSAVPVFFMISGYFYSSVESKSAQKKQIIKTLKLLFFSTIIYIIWDVVHSFITFEPPLALSIFPTFTMVRLDYFFFRDTKPWLYFLIFNLPPVGSHLWYLSAFLYVLVFIWASNHFVERKKLYILIPILLTVSLFLSCYSKILLDWQLKEMVYRNFLFMALPFFLLGDYLRECKFCKNLSTPKICVVFFLSIILVYVENAFLKNFDPSFKPVLYIGTVFMSISMLLLAERDLAIYRGILLGLLARWGRLYSLDIYIIHMLLWGILKLMLDLITQQFPEFSTLYVLTGPIIIMSISLLTAAVWRRIKLFIKN
ncbi:MAG: acyltransferase family protein [Oscillospiraceae bacterium]|nr:acyltransferase family protein [Oscillospiraceae bacterium]